MLINRQKQYAVSRGDLEQFIRRLRRRLPPGRRQFNVCLVDDRSIRRWNRTYLGRDRPTDVLSFPWGGGVGRREFAHFLGDIAISVETARRRAAAEGRSALNELCRLILHGALHLLGYDHERDRGEMAFLEHAWRAQMGIEGRRRAGKRGE